MTDAKEQFSLNVLVKLGKTNAETHSVLKTVFEANIFSY
jgi:hypothetical protein